MKELTSNKKEIQLTREEVEIIQTAIDSDDSAAIEYIMERIPELEDKISREWNNNKSFYRPSIFLRMEMDRIQKEWNHKIIDLDIDEIDLIQSVIEKGRYKDLLELEKRLPVICGEIRLNPIRASKRLENSMIKTYKSLSKKNRSL